MYMYVPMVLVNTNEKLKTMRVRTAETSESRIEITVAFVKEIRIQKPNYHTVLFGNFKKILFHKIIAN